MAYFKGSRRAQSLPYGLPRRSLVRVSGAVLRHVFPDEAGGYLPGLRSRERLIRSCEIVSDGYARFELGVGEVVAAAPGIEIVAGSRLAVTWVNSAFYLPDKLDDNYGRYLVALIAPGSDQPPLRGPSAFITGPPEPGTYTILQAHCSDAFLFPADDLIAIALLQVLQTDRDQKRELQILSEFLFKNGASGVVKRKIFEAAHPRP